MFVFDDTSDSPWKVIVADDDADVHTITRLALNGFEFLERKLELFSAYTCGEAKDLIRQHPDAAVLLLDVVMDDKDSGLKVVKFVRDTLQNRLVRIVLRTGQPAYAPQMQIVRNYDINDYKEKIELTEQKLIATMISSIRSFRDLCLIEQQRSALQNSLMEKEALLKEVHHRVKNNLQVISSLLSIQSMNTKDEESRKMCQVSRDRVRTMALIHEELYSSENFGRINFSDYIHTLAQELMALYEPPVPVSFNFSVQQVTLCIDHAVPCGLIVNELITNALKFAFANSSRGSIYIDLKRRGDLVELFIGDDGSGLPDGFSLQDASTLGLQLISVLTSQIEARVEVTTAGGTGFRIIFSDTQEE
ncbi:histidine kinase dimerization/phosphoacceptor domain -containing protein [Marispirochaeta sp.]|uniref:sensor histidine kinase n=1 Tax=Marispirochaeta sp. TaxID=2038653 RepID=UPI0029C7B902|nr:histidine kinase dimerization/phosphoacceptor domain -containing protein [Marispirochaeta sp.]